MPCRKFISPAARLFSAFVMLPPLPPLENARLPGDSKASLSRRAIVSIGNNCCAAPFQRCQKFLGKDPQGSGGWKTCDSHVIIHPFIENVCVTGSSNQPRYGWNYIVIHSYWVSPEIQGP